MASSWLSLCLLLLFLHGSSARFEKGRCRFESLEAQEPKFREESEGGFTEHFDQNNEQFQCAGVSAFRRTIRPKSQLLTSYSNSHRLVYMIQGQSICGVLMSGCPETFQSFEGLEPCTEQEGGQSSQRGDQHQKIHRFSQGDVLAVPAGVAYWCYNDGNSSSVAITVMDTSNNANQLDPNRREFLLAGSRQKSGGQQQQPDEENIFKGLDTQLLADSFGVSKEIAQKLQQTPKKGRIVKVERCFQVVQPERIRSESEWMKGKNDQLSFCNMRIKENIDRPERADVYNPRGGRLTTLNVQKLPILDFIQMSAFRGVLYQDALVAPHWDTSAHSVMYVTKGQGQVQIVGDQGKSVFNGVLREGQLIITPSNFVVVKKAKSESFEWVSVKTNGNSIQNQIAGKQSIFTALPLDVISNSYSDVSREDAWKLKNNNKDQHIIITPRTQQEGRTEAAWI